MDVKGSQIHGSVPVLSSLLNIFKLGLLLGDIIRIKSQGVVSAGHFILVGGNTNDSSTDL